MRNLALIILAAMLWPAVCPAQRALHFITDDGYRHQVMKDFNQKEQLIGTQFTNKIAELRNQEEAEAMMFL